MILQKACQNCTRAKRRCTLQLPRCVRCFNKGLDCHYVLEPLVQRNNHDKPEPEKLRGTAKTRDPTNAEWEVNIASLAEFVHSMHLSGCVVVAEIPQCRGLSLWRPSSKSVPLRTDSITTRFLADRLRQLPSIFLQSNSAPFCHPQLYSQSVHMQLERVWDSCRTQPAHSPYPEAGGALLKPLDQGQERSGDVETSLLTELAATHSMIFLLITSLFGDSPRSMPEIESAEFQLQALVRRVERLYNHAPREIPSCVSPWRAWILAESVRRTILTTYLLRGVYSLIMYGFCMHEIFVYALPFDARKGVWEAQSESEWDWLRSNGIQHDPLVSLQEFMLGAVRGSDYNTGVLETLLLVSHHGKSAMEKHLSLTI